MNIKREGIKKKQEINQKMIKQTVDRLYVVKNKNIEKQNEIQMNQKVKVNKSMKEKRIDKMKHAFYLID